MRRRYPNFSPSIRAAGNSFRPAHFHPVKKAMRSTYSRVRSFVAAALRPPAEEVEAYARVIAELEGRPLAECRTEAELQLWVWHAEHAHPVRRSARRAVA
jgi:hypothetical protein